MKIPINEKWWMKKLESGNWKIGMSPNFVDQLGIVWAFIPSESTKVSIGQTLANVESAKCLAPIRSPVNGDIVKWNRAFVDDPETINSEQYLVIIKPEPNYAV